MLFDMDNDPGGMKNSEGETAVSGGTWTLS